MGDQKCHYSENVDEVIEGSSGISLVRRGNYASEIVLRGLSSDRLNITIDGMKIFSACTDKMDPVNSYVAATNMKSVQCEKGGESSCFGSNTGGQVNFQLKDPVLNDEKKLRGNLSLGGNSVSHGMQASFNTNYSEKNWAVRVNGMAADHDSYRAGGGEVVNFSQYRKTNLGIYLKAKFSEKDFVQADLIMDDAYDVGYPALPMDVAFAKGRIYSMTYKRYFTSSWASKVKVKVYGNNITHLMDDSQRDVVMHMDMPGWSDTYGAYLTFDSRQLARNNISLTLDAYNNRSLAEMTMYPEGEREMFMLTWPDVDRSVVGIYILDRLVITDRDEVSFTARLDQGNSLVLDEFGRKQFEVFGYDLDQTFEHEAISYGMSYDRSLDPRNQIGLSLSYGERLPTISETIRLLHIQQPG